MRRTMRLAVPLVRKQILLIIQRAGYYLNFYYEKNLLFMAISHP